MQIDHVLIAVDDLDEAARTYEGLLGLPPAVRSEHPAYGTRNALFVFERGGYLELLGLQPRAGQERMAVALRRFLAARGSGLYGVALTPSNLDEAIARLRADGLAIEDAAHGTAVNADGRVREWRNTPLPDGVLHGALGMLIVHQGWDWRTELRPAPLPGRERSHVRRIDHIVFAVQDADAASAAWERRFGEPRQELIPMPDALIAVHPAGDANVELIAPTNTEGRIGRMVAESGEQFIGLSVEVPDLDATVAAVRAVGAEVTDPATGILPRTRIARISPPSACGVPLQLLERI